MAASGSTKVILISLMANAGIALAKFAAAFITGSASMLAEAIHSFSDCANQLLLLHGNRVAAKPPTDKHPLGRGKETFFWSFVVALMLFSLGGLFSVYEGMHKLAHLEPLEHPALAVGVLVFACVLEFFSLRSCLQEARKDPIFRSYRQWIRETTKADVLVLLLENLAAMVGLSVALGMLAMAWLTHNPAWDAAGSVCVGVLLIIIAAVLAREVKSLLIGEAPVTNYQQPLGELLAATISGATLHKLIAIQHGIDCVVVVCKIRITDTQLSAHALAAQVQRFEESAKQRFPEIKWQFCEVVV